MRNLRNAGDISGVINNDDELVTSETSSDRTQWHHCANASTHYLQQLVSGTVPERIIDALETIDVHEEHSNFM